MNKAKTLKKGIATALLVLATASATKATNVPDWVQKARLAGLSLQSDATPMMIEQAVIKLKNENVSVVELDTSLSKYWTDAEFANEVAFINTVAQEIHNQGMKVVVYYPAMEVVTPGGETSSRSMYKDHPNWVQIGFNGQANVFYGSQEDWVNDGDESCWMSPNGGYADYFKGRCAQLVTNTVVDGLWVDVPLYLDTGAPWSDVSPAAAAAYTTWSAARGDNGGSGFSVPTVADFNDPNFRNWLQWRHENLASFIEDVRVGMHTLDPNFIVAIETYPMDYMDTVWTGLDPAYMARPDNFLRVWEVDSVSNAKAMKYSSIEDFSNKIAMYKWARGIDRDMPTWSFVYGYEALDMGLTMAASVAAKNSPFESQTPIMTKTSDAQTRTRWYEFIKNNDEALLNVDRLARVGMWFSSTTREYRDMADGAQYGMYLEENPPTPDADWWAQVGNSSLRWAPHLSGWRGAAHGLHQLGVTYKVIQTPGADAAQIGDVSLIWLPSVGCLSDAEAQLIRDFVSNGGTVFATGKTPGMYDETGAARSVSALDDLFGFSGNGNPVARMNEFGQGVAIYRPELKGADLFAGQGGNSGLATRTLGEVEQIVRIHTRDDLIVSLPEGVFTDVSEVTANQQHVYIVNYTGLQQPLIVNLIDLPVQYRAPEGFTVTGATVHSPDAQSTSGSVPVAEVSHGVFETIVRVDQFAMITFDLAPETPAAPQGPTLNFANSARQEAVTAGLNFIRTKMRDSSAPAPVKYGVRTNLKDNNDNTDVYTGGHHVTGEHMGLYLRVTSLVGDQVAFNEGYDFVREILFSKGYHVFGWSMHKDKHKRFLQADELNGQPVQLTANAPLDDLRAIHGLLDGEYLNPAAAALGRKALNGMFWTSVTDRKRGVAPMFPNYPGGLLGYSWDWADHDDPTTTPAAVGTGLGRLGTFPIPVDYQDLETMAMGAAHDPRWKGPIASAVDLQLGSEIPTAPGLFYNGLGENNTWTGDFEYPGERQGEHLKVIQELWTILHLKRISATAPWILDADRRNAAGAAAQRGYNVFKNFYLANNRIPEYLTMAGQDVPDGNTGNALVRGVENLFYGEARIYAQLARLALLFGDNAFAAQVIDEKILTDRVSDVNDPRYGMIGVSTTGADDSEAWNTLESLLTLCLEAKANAGSNNGNNTAPVANADNIIAGKDTLRRIKPVELLGNDTDADGDILSVLTVDATSAQGATITLSNGDYNYSPVNGFLGTDTFNYTITDAAGATSSATVTVEVMEGVGGPVGVVLDGDLSDWPTGVQSVTDPVDITGANNPLDVLEMHIANDATKIYLAYKTKTQVTFNEGFTLHLDTDRNPNTGFAMWYIGSDYLLQGPSLFRYAGNGTDWAWTYIGDVHLGVDGTTIETSFNRNWIGNPAKFDYLLYGDNEAFDGDVTAVDYIPNNYQNLPGQGPAYLTYTMVDEGGTTPANQAPVAQNVSVTTTEATTVNITLLGSDPDGDNITFDFATFPTRGDVVLNGQQVAYTPHAGQTGSDSFNFSVSDGQLTATGTVSITINAADNNTGGDTNTNSTVTITLDGDLSDWATVNSVGSGLDVPNTANNLIDLQALKLSGDANNLYVAYQNESPITLNWGFTLYLDTDRNPNTGFGMWDTGADYVIQGNGLYKYAGTGADWNWTWVTTVNAGVSGNNAELSVSRAALGNPDKFHYMFWGENSAFGGTDFEILPATALTGGETYLFFEFGAADTTTDGGDTGTDNTDGSTTTNDTNTVNITLDGNLSDWSNVPVHIQDADDVTGAENKLDILEIHFHNDADDYYLAYKNDGDILLNWGYSFYLDTDSQYGTGFGLWDIGADYLVSAGDVYKYTGNGSDWSWEWVGPLDKVVNGDVMEARFPKAFLGTTSATIRTAFYGENAASGGTAVDVAPQNLTGTGTGETFVTYTVK